MYVTLSMLRAKKTNLFLKLNNRCVEDKDTKNSQTQRNKTTPIQTQFEFITNLVFVLRLGRWRFNKTIQKNP